MTNRTRFPQARPATYAGLFTVASATLMYEVVLTRVLGVTAWHHVGLVAISVALWGTSVGALLVHVRPQWFGAAAVKRQMALCSLLLAVFVALAFVVHLAVPFVPAANVAGVASAVAACVVLSLPFVCSGVVVCLALTRLDGRVSRLYAADLLGAALGCVVVVVGFEVVDGPSLGIAGAALAALGAVVLAVDAGSGHRTRWGLGVLATLAAFSAANAHLYAQGHAPLEVQQANVREDDTGDPDETDDLRRDVGSLVYHATEGDDLAAIAGVGRERDVVAALELGVGRVTVIAANETMRTLPDDSLGHLVNDPRVGLVNDDPRSWLARTGERFDIIQIPLADTWAATAAGAPALRQASLFTTEAWHMLLDRLRPGGVVSVTLWHRHESAEPVETLRATALAAQVLHERGVTNLRRHMLVYEGPARSPAQGVATLLVSPEPFDLDTITLLDGVGDELGFVTVLVPFEAADERFAALTGPAGPARAVPRFSADIAPPTDDRPFFFQTADLGSLRRLDGFDEGGVPPVWTLLAVGVSLLLLTGVCNGGRLLRAARAHRWRSSNTMIPGAVCFAGVGLGSVLVAQSQLTQISTFLGHPAAVPGVIMATLLLFGGLGCLLVERLTDTDRPDTLARPISALLVVVIAMGFTTPRVVAAVAGETTGVRVAAAVGLLAPLALFTGMQVPVNLVAAGRAADAPTALLWAVHGAMSAAGLATGTVIVVLFGATATLASGLAAYAVAALALWIALGVPAGVDAAEAPATVVPGAGSATDGAGEDRMPVRA